MKLKAIKTDIRVDYNNSINIHKKFSYWSVDFKAGLSDIRPIK